LIVSDISLVC